MRFQTGYYFRKGMVVQQDFEKGRSQRLWFRRYNCYKNLAIFFRVSRWGRRGGGLYAVLYGTCFLDILFTPKSLNEYFALLLLYSRFCTKV